MNRYDKVPYVKHGRTLEGMDCWGLVRLGRADLFGKPVLPLWGDIDPMDKARLTRACAATVAAHLRPCAAMPGAIAAAYHGSVCVHVGLVIMLDARLMVLHTDEPAGVERTPLAAFASRYSEVKFYD